MKEENAQYLEKRLVYTGFGEELIPELRQNMAEGKEKFELKFEKEINGKKVEANLKYSLSNQGNYFFNAYDLKINQTDKEPLERTFKVDNKETFSLKEAFNLLEGRSVLKSYSNFEKGKEDSKITELQSWSYLDASIKNNKRETANEGENGVVTKNIAVMRKCNDYDLDSLVSMYPIKNIEIPGKKADLVQSLQRGNLQSVLLEKDGEYKKHFIEASPKFKTINIYNEQMVKLFIPNKKKEDLKTSEKQDNAEKLIQPGKNKQGNKNKNSQGVR
ncbi:hypothetical protein D3C71_1014500 [compost metagenome]